MSFDVYSLYKPLKNNLAKLCLEDSLRVIWAYIQNFQFGSEFDGDIQTPSGYIYSSYHSKLRICAPWELETLAKLLIVEADDWSHAGRDLREIKSFSKALNKLKEIENSIAGKYVNQGNVLVEMFRIAHRQFPWQDTDFKNTFVRHYQIYSTPKLAELIKDVLGITVEELYFTGFLFFGMFLNKPFIDGAINTEQLKHCPIHVDAFLKLYCLDYMDLKKRLSDEIELNDKFAYSLSSLRAYPIIRMVPRKPNRLSCPLPTLLLWQLTGALYYKVADEIHATEEPCRRKTLSDAFGRYLGEAFQSHVEKLLCEAAAKWGIRYMPESEYKDGKNIKRTVDFVLYDKDTLFVECKTKRIRYPAKVELSNQDLIEEDLRIIAESIVQIYKAIEEFKNGKYGGKYNVCKGNIYPLLLTLEKLYIFDASFGSKLASLVEAGLLREKIGLECLERSPYSWCCVDEFQKIVKIISKEGIEEFMSPKVKDREMKTWQYFTYISNSYSQYSPEDFVLSNDYDAIFEKYIGAKQVTT